MTLDEIVQKETTANVNRGNINPNQESNFSFIETYDADKYHNSKSKQEKQAMLKEYRQECNEYLMTELHLSEKKSKWITNHLHVPRNEITFTDILIGLSVANLSHRYLEPVSKITRTKELFYTKVNILADIFFLGVSTFLSYEINKEHNSETITYVCNLLKGSGSDWLIYSNDIARVIQIPYRIVKYFQGKHTWSPATIINPNIPEAVIASGFFIHDQVQKHPKLKRTLKNIETYVIDKYKEIKQNIVN